MLLLIFLALSVALLFLEVLLILSEEVDLAFVPTFHIVLLVHSFPIFLFETTNVFIRFGLFFFFFKGTTERSSRLLWISLLLSLVVMIWTTLQTVLRVMMSLTWAVTLH